LVFCFHPQTLPECPASFHFGCGAAALCNISTQDRLVSQKSKSPHCENTLRFPKAIFQKSKTYSELARLHDVLLCYRGCYSENCFKHLNRIIHDRIIHDCIIHNDIIHADIIP
jgi:hypothetical protein